jgi:hypothetical protein
MTTDETIEAGARTVVSVAEQFRELKVLAERLLQSETARRRGFFTPSEDQQVRQLLVFYWKSRCALTDVVASFHQRLQSCGDERYGVFLVGFAGALVLVDAARYLREHFHDQPIIRQKLNEPEPNFGIPGDVYDMVQESLTRPLHIWHLYHAATFFEEHHAELVNAVATDQTLQPVLAIIDEHAARLRIQKRDYLVARLRVRTRQLVTNVQRDLLMRAIYGLQKLAGSLAAHVSVVPTHRPHLPPEIIAQLRAYLAPGDVLVTRKEYAITNYFLPGHWPHAALFLGDTAELERRGLAASENFRARWPRLCACDQQEPKRVLEAMKDGVLIRSLRSPCSTDSVVVLRPRLTSDQVNEALARGMFHEGKSYDFGFDFTRSDRLVCTEVVYRAYEGIGGVGFRLSTKAGRLVLSGDDLVKQALREEHFDVAGVYLKPAADKLLTEDAARKVVERVAAGV